MSRSGLVLAAGAIVAAVGIIVLDQTGHGDLVRMGTVAFLALTAIVGVVAYVKASEPDVDRAAHRASQKEFARALRRGRLPEDPTHDEAIRRLAAEHRSRMASVRYVGVACGLVFIVLGLLRGRIGTVVFGAALVLLWVAVLPLRRRRLRTLDRLDAALDARRADDTRPA